jgi:RNA polymerase sigma factor (TIGR02999 family)
MGNENSGSDARRNLTLLLEEASNGQREAADKLFAIVYEELKRMANAQVSSEAKGNTLQSTALVHEVWIKLIGKQEGIQWNNRGHFFAAAAQAMRRILVDAARSRRRLKRGGGMQKVELQDHDLTIEQDDQLLALDEALELLCEQDEKKARLVNLRYFAGLTNAQAAEQLGVSTATADRYWTYAKAWLRSKMEG